MLPWGSYTHRTVTAFPFFRESVQMNAREISQITTLNLCNYSPKYALENVGLPLIFMIIK